jgi:hypothetical protein
MADDGDGNGFGQYFNAEDAFNISSDSEYDDHLDSGELK